MRIIRDTDHTKEECLRRVAECEWLMKNAPILAGYDYYWDQARLWRSLYYVAKPADKR
jgi:hypothetical protein